ncbi:Neuronal acetylcholine receptor subunit alpha-3 [Heterocephalus glaber]|uniref:Neuronal acetylcholine receptor subunit alpha-3 n=1 Tax=Heterocephalus glaber TaxID=10181 RepID=G5C377_HETGA|nr:Neuronal acetylcholine receptor subunit alpha-3 [Heterocephalus glaber]
MEVDQLLEDLTASGEWTAKADCFVVVVQHFQSEWLEEHDWGSSGASYAQERLVLELFPGMVSDSLLIPQPLNGAKLSNLNCFSHVEVKGCKEGCPCQEGTCDYCHHRGVKISNFSASLTRSSSSESVDAALSLSALSLEIKEVIQSVKYIAENMKAQNKAKEIQDDWKYVAMVIDRMFSWVFILVHISGTAGLFLQPLMVRGYL